MIFRWVQSSASFRRRIQNRSSHKKRGERNWTGRRRRLRDKRKTEKQIKTTAVAWFTKGKQFLWLVLQSFVFRLLAAGFLFFIVNAYTAASTTHNDPPSRESSPSGMKFLISSFPIPTSHHYLARWWIDPLNGLVWLAVEPWWKGWGRHGDEDFAFVTLRRHVTPSTTYQATVNMSLPVSLPVECFHLWAMMSKRLSSRHHDSSCHAIHLSPIMSTHSFVPRPLQYFERKTWS